MLNLIHHLRLPENSAGRPAPAVVMVHGWQGNERVMGIFERTVPPGAIIISPRAPVEVGTYLFGWHKLEDGEVDFQSGVDALRLFVRDLPQAYPVDPRRVLLMGFSQGASMCYALLLSEPGLAFGVAGLAGFLSAPSRRWLAPGRLAGKPVFIAHGADDDKVPLEQARATRDDLTRAGADVEYHEYQGVGHKLNAQGVHALTRWLAAHLGVAAS
jgi:phospholipase/carboxylesterase